MTLTASAFPQTVDGTVLSLHQRLTRCRRWASELETGSTGSDRAGNGHAGNDNGTSNAVEDRASRIATLVTELESLAACVHEARVLPAIDSGERVEELSAHALQLLAVFAMLGEWAGQMAVVPGSGGAPGSGGVLVSGSGGAAATTALRLEQLQRVARYWREFLERCEAIDGLLDEGDASARVLGHVADPSAQRELKIRRFKRQRALRAEMDALRLALDLKRKQLGINDDVDNDDLEEEQRAWTVHALRLAAHDAVEQLASVEQERALLEDFMAREHGNNEQATVMSRGRRCGTGAGEDDAARLDIQTSSIRNASGPLLSKGGKIMRPFVITNHREELARQVFRAGHNLPTMSIDEYLEQEYAQGNIISGGGKPPAEKQAIDDMDHAALDAETMRQREWDNYVEANPKGSGNTMNRG